MLCFFIFIIFNLEHKWTRLMLYPLRNTIRKTHDSSRKPIKTTSLKPGDGITLMRIFDLRGKIPGKHRFIEIARFSTNSA
jgi:hypothetical protein